ncbi:MAG: tRNA lysidine(34) synthetase TilS [Candidatus Latescibacterota bacterium]
MTLEANNRDKTADPDLAQVRAIRLIESVKWFIIKEELIAAGSLVLAAVSGGPDSMAMLSILRALSAELGFRIKVAHFDHRLRASSAEDLALVEQHAASCSLELIAGSDDVRERAASSGDTIEEAARKARYEFLYRSAGKVSASHIATGHTRNDQVETVIMRLVRGCGIRGLAGIPVRRGELIRPLLATAREDAYAYCKACNIPFISDPSNDDPQFFRNRIRLEVVPFLKTVQPSVEENILRLCDNAGRLVQSIRDKTQPLLERHCRKLSDNEWKLNVTKLSRIDDTALVILLGDLFTERMRLDMDYTQPHFEQLVRLARTVTDSGKSLSLPNLHVKREFENLIFSTGPARTASTQPGPVNATLPIPGRTVAGNKIFIAEIMEPDAAAGRKVGATADTAYFAMDRIPSTMTIRNPRPGERMQPFGMKGSKKISDIWVDRKIPGRERSNLVVLCDSEGILWLVGAVTSERGRITEKTKIILKITVQQE